MSEERRIEAKQVIVVRRDLKMKAGKLAAQVSHASMAPITNRLRATEEMDNVGGITMSIYFSEEHDDAFYEWIKGSFAKVVLEINSEQELLDLIATAEMAKIPNVQIVDEGRTAFNGVPTLTCASFGPCYGHVLDELTGHLKLYSAKG